MSISRWISYELPLNERVRAFMRLEHLFDQFARHRTGEDPWDSRAAINSLLEALAILGRGDVRSEVLKEMEKQAQTLAKLRNRNGIDDKRLDSILGSLDKLKARLDATPSQVGKELKNNEFLAAIRQRNSIPGGTCGFDLPSLQNWLLSSPDSRQQDMSRWHAVLEPLERSLRLVLMLLRESESPTDHVAEKGYFQHSLNNHSSYQLIRVSVQADDKVFPEISGGKHRLSIRFLEQPDTGTRPRQTENSIKFRLVCCQL